MDTKRFVAENSKLAFQMVKDELGADAVIIANRQIPEGVEIIAGENSILEESLSAQSDSFAEILPPRKRLATVSDSTGERDGIDTKIDDLKRYIAGELTAIKIGNWATHDSARFQLFRDLVSLGFSLRLVSRIVSLLDDGDDYSKMQKDALQEIIWSINTGPLSCTPVEALSGVVMLHGLAGSGKTTTMARMASRVIAEHGKDSVVLVNADNRRMGGQQQVVSFGKILEIPVLQVRRGEELPEILRAVENRKLVLVDNPGLSVEEMVKKDAIGLSDWQHESLKHLLVVPASSQSALMARVLNAPWKRRIDGVVLTKVDEAIQLGECISNLIESHLPALYYSDGRNITNDLHVLHADMLVQAALDRRTQIQPSSDAMIDDTIAALMHQNLNIMH